jgi:hypothetical protein
MSKLGAPMLNKDVYLQVQTLMGTVGKSLLDLVSDLVKLAS